MFIPGDVAFAKELLKMLFLRKQLSVTQFFREYLATSSNMLQLTTSTIKVQGLL